MSLFQELHRAYIDARKHKRSTVNQLRFERNLESELLSLAEELKTLSYKISPSICFINEVPVKREVVAADFRDRVIHHFLFNRIYPIFDRKFIYDSYSCRVGKGTLFGIKRAVRYCEGIGSKGFSLRLDICGYFMSINKSILCDLMLKCLRAERGRAGCGGGVECGGAGDALTEFLIRKIVFADPLSDAKFKSPPSAWSDLPKDKSLRYSAPNCGLPIGNLTSQLFSNIYLNPLDHFIKRELKIKCYGRYVDDMLLIHGDKRVLLNAVLEVRAFLAEKLQLKLHPKKIKLQPLSNGFSFLGAFIKPDRAGKFRARAGRRIADNFRNCVLRGGQGVQVQSYLGLF